MGSSKQWQEGNCSLPWCWAWRQPRKLVSPCGNPVGSALLVLSKDRECCSLPERVSFLLPDSIVPSTKKTSCQPRTHTCPLSPSLHTQSWHFSCVSFWNILCRPWGLGSSCIFTGPRPTKDLTCRGHAAPNGHSLKPVESGAGLFLFSHVYLGAWIYFSHPVSSADE